MLYCARGIVSKGKNLIRVKRIRIKYPANILRREKRVKVWT